MTPIFRLSFTLVLFHGVACSLFLSFPSIQVDQSAVTRTQTSQSFLLSILAEPMDSPQQRLRLALALSDYQDRIEAIRKQVLTQANNYITGSQCSITGTHNIVLGSNVSIRGSNNWIVSNRAISSLQIEHDIIYLDKWRIDMALLDFIESSPNKVIRDLD